VLSTPIRDDSRAPRWLVRWLITFVLLLGIACITYVIHWELTLPERLEAQLHRLNCEFAQQVALSESDRTKANLKAAVAALVCRGP
jgi:hypothetical protein